MLYPNLLMDTSPAIRNLLIHSHQSCYTKLKMAKETLVMLYQTFFLMDNSPAIGNILMARKTPVLLFQTF
ncbi:hypothetical protein DPMN_012802 [Dreissena polymorpha]|uniref:Uncharacterized protein n=1 Tax=Dreissena polymorpha TaxID=45954 RepID=A0A9D4N8Q0_DREPO|nr:hypothetical protein DPMN_012802 [Dreissena polymorpha]